jgi:hypothetical protein
MFPFISIVRDKIVKSTQFFITASTYGILTNLTIFNHAPAYFRTLNSLGQTVLIVFPVDRSQQGKLLPMFVYKFYSLSQGVETGPARCYSSALTTRLEYLSLDRHGQNSGFFHFTSKVLNLAQ